MEYARLGSSDLTVSRVGFGCAAIGGFDYGAVDDRESRRAVRRALDEGINFFDAADVYGFGHAEAVLSDALGLDRHRVVIATKGGVRWGPEGKTWRDLGRTALQQAVDGSLRRLRIDCIPLYQVHWPDGRTPMGEVGELLSDFVRAGKVRYSGVCNMTLQELAGVQSGCELISLQVPFSCAERQCRDVIVGAREGFGVSTLAYNVLAQGFFSGKHSGRSSFAGTDLRRVSKLFHGIERARNERLLRKIRAIAQRYGVSPVQVAIRWVLQTGYVTCALVGIKTDAQAVEDASAADLRLTQEDMNLLSAADSTEPREQRDETEV